MCHEARAADPLSLLTLSESLKDIVNRVIRWLRDHSCSVIEPGSAHTACRGAAIASLGVPCSALSPALNCALLLTPLGKLDKNMSFECIQLHKSCWKALKASIYEVHSG